MWRTPERTAEELEGSFLLVESSFLEEAASVEGHDNDELISQGVRVHCLGGERVVQCQRDVELVQSATRVVGQLFLTSYRLLFVPDSGGRVHSVPLGCIAQVEVHYNCLRVLCKYFRLLEFYWTQDALQDLNSSVAGASALQTAASAAPPLASMSSLASSFYFAAPSASWAVSSTAYVAAPAPVHAFRQALCDQTANAFALLHAILDSETPPGTVHTFYSGIGQELQRLAIPMTDWRITSANSAYKLCATYPASLCVPAAVTDEQLAGSAAFRSMGRLPALCWYSTQTGAAMLRCAQPLVGLLQASCAEDELIVEAARRGGSLYFVDARPKISAYANLAKGAGTENIANYPNCKLVFLGIENIHAVRQAHKLLFDLLLGQCLSGESTSGWYAGIEKTGWMELVQSVVRGAAKVVEMMDEEGASVVIHCTDGWDRTAQIAGLAQLLMDPYYRTAKGFVVLIEKEWLSFGHKFSDRHCHKRMGFWSDHEASPIFAQWLDCVYQVMTQFPNAFEFNEKFLITILDNSYSLRYSTFMESCERDRLKYRGLPSLWQNVLGDPFFLNETYVPCSDTLKVEWHTPAVMTIWKGLYLRFFVRRNEVVGALSQHDPDFEHDDSTGTTNAVGEWEVARSDHQVHLAPIRELTIFDDYECPVSTEIPLRVASPEAAAARESSVATYAADVLGDVWTSCQQWIAKPLNLIKENPT